MTGDEGQLAPRLTRGPCSRLRSGLTLVQSPLRSVATKVTEGPCLPLEPVLCPTGDYCGLRVGGRPTRVSGHFPPSPRVLVIVSSPGSAWVLVRLRLPRHPSSLLCGGEPRPSRALRVGRGHLPRGPVFPSTGGSALVPKSPCGSPLCVGHSATPSSPLCLGWGTCLSGHLFSVISQDLPPSVYP